MTDIFRTAPENAEDVAGWFRLPSGIEIMREPFVDRPSGLYSRLSYGDLEALAGSIGAQLVSMATLLEAWKFGVRLPPVQLITGTIEEQREKTKHMMSRAFCELHDSQVRTFIRASGWDRSARGTQPLSNVGKQWIRGATPGKARNGGWFNSRGIPTQPGGSGSEHHNREYTDYSQLATLERAPGISMPPAPADPRPPGVTMSTPSLGLRALAQARELLAKRVREAPGIAVDAQVSAFLQPCRRGGTPVAGILDMSGQPLGLRDDATAWCAAFASHCLAVALLVADTDDAERVPHGYRASVAELVADAKARGAWRGPTERPELGWLAIWTRAGGDPVRGGTGHVGRVSWVGDATYSTIEGNHADAVAEVVHRRDEESLRGWVVT